MPNIRPYNYVSGSTLYASTTYSSAHEGLAMYYSKYYAQCGWAALFYNNTGKDIIITNIYAMISANGANIRAKFSCKDVGTSIPDSSPISAVAGSVEVIVPRYGTTIGGWTSTSANVSVAKNHYFIAGIRTTQMDNGSWFNMARTNNNTAMNCYYSEFSGDFKRDTNTGWKSQTPEIYVSYKEASQPTYINGKRNETLEFWQGDSVSFTLSGYNNQRVIDSPTGFTITSSGSTYTVISDPSAADKTATININGYNSSSQLSLKSKYPRYISFSSTHYTLRPGQKSQLFETHIGSNNELTYSTNNNLTFNPNNRLSTIDNYSIYHNANADSNTNFIDEVATTVTTKIKYNDSDISGGDISNGIVKELEITSQHWDPSDINIVLNKFKVAKDNSDYITITNNTNLSNVISDNFNKVNVVSDNSYIKFSTDDGGTWSNSIQLNKNDECRVKWTGSTESGVGDTSVNLTINLVNDYSINIEIPITAVETIPFSVIYPVNKFYDTSGSTQAHYESIESLPLYGYDVNPSDINSGYCIPANYPIKIQYPSFDTGITANKYKVSIDCMFGHYESVSAPPPIGGRVAFINDTATLFSDGDNPGPSQFSILLSDADTLSDEKSIRTYIINLPKRLNLSNLSNVESILHQPVFNRLLNIYPGSPMFNNKLICRLIIKFIPIDTEDLNITNTEITKLVDLSYSIYMSPDKTPRKDELIQYTKYDNSNPPVIIDDSINRVLNDAQRINYLYGRLQSEVSEIKDLFFNKDNDNNYTDGKYISETQYFIETQLSGLYAIIDKLKNSPECKSEQTLKDKLILPRFKIASNFPICWDDKDPNSLALLQKYIPPVDLNYFTASPIMETLKTVESFQTYYENVNIIYDDQNNYNIIYVDNDNNSYNINYHLYN